MLTPGFFLESTATISHSVVGPSAWTDGAADGDFSNTPNWSPATVPNSGSIVRLASGSTQLTDGLNQSAVTYSEMYFGTGFTGGMSAALQVNATRCVVNAGADLSLDGTFEHLYVLDTNGWTLTLAGTIENLYVLAGDVVVSDDLVLTNLYCTPRAGKRSVVTVGSDVNPGVTSANGAGPDIMRLHEGSYVTTQSGVNSSLEIYGKAECRFIEDATGADDPMQGLEIHEGSKVWHDTGGKVTSMTMYGGSFTFNDNEESTHNVTNATIYNGTMDLRTGKGSLNLTGSLTYYGGHTRFDEGSTLAI
jgi:X-X-X-Leu-X-X-Gly heptad repeat protein